MIRRWLKSIILECLYEKRLEAATVIIGNKVPGSDDYNYASGSIWIYEDRKFVLKEIVANWEEDKDLP